MTVQGTCTWTIRWIALAAFASVLMSAAANRAVASDAVVAELMARDLIGMPGKEVTMETVEYAPGGKSPPHSHHAQVFVYVLEGSLRMQVQGSPVETLGPGGTFYESPDDIHTVSENASQTKPARFLVVTVKDKTAGGGGKPDQSGQGRAQAAGRPLLGLAGPDLVLRSIDSPTTRRTREPHCRSHSMKADGCFVRSGYARFRGSCCSMRGAASRRSSAQTTTDSQTRCACSSPGRQPRHCAPLRGKRARVTSVSSWRSTRSVRTVSPLR